MAEEAGEQWAPNVEQDVHADPKREREPEGPARHEAIARRAYEISLSEEGGTPEQNWRRAEEELSR